VHFLHVVHDRETHPAPGLLGDAMLEQGHTMVVWDMQIEERTPRDFLDFDGTVFYGGQQDVAERALHPWLEAEEEMISALCAASRPLLGICLGAQLLAKALGGAVVGLSEPEIGWQEVWLEAAAASDPLFHSLPHSFLAVEWHHNDFLCPPEAMLLARSSACVQAFRKGRAWGVQFHPEATDEILFRWAQEGWPGCSGAGAAVLDSERERRLLADWNLVGHALAEAFIVEAASSGRGNDSRASSDALAGSR
jgi:GMP synthase-like glutamine amidotransferase